MFGMSVKDPKTHTPPATSAPEIVPTRKDMEVVGRV